MEEDFVPFKASSSITAPPSDLRSTPLTTNVFPTKDDESEEWEYEYSTTETETFYVTLDLGVPDMPLDYRAEYAGRPRRPMWTNPGLPRQQERGSRNAPMTFKAAEAVDGSVVETPADGEEQERAEGDTPAAAEDDKEQEVEVEEQEDPETPATQGNTRTPAEERSIEKPLETIQILDLHSENPIVSYDGQVYSCEWARNIGTEMIFTSQDTAASLPVLRHLPDGAVLLAASSARIISKPLVVESKSNEEDEIASKGKRGIVSRGRGGIQIDARASEARHSQANFLQRMMAIKQAKGEEDRVTLKVEARGSSLKWRNKWKNFLMKEKARLNKVLEEGNLDDRIKAKRMLEELKKDEEMSSDRKRRGRGGKAPGRKRKIRFDLDEDEKIEDGLSIPTPERWDNMEGEGEDDGSKDREGVEEDLEGHGGLTDVDAPSGDEDDKQMYDVG